MPLHPNGNVLNRLADSRPRDLTQMDGMHTIGGLMKDSIRSMTTYPGRMTAELIAYDARDLSQTRPWVAGMYHAVQRQYMPSILQVFLSNAHSGFRGQNSCRVLPHVLQLGTSCGSQPLKHASSAAVCCLSLIHPDRCSTGLLCNHKDSGMSSSHIKKQPPTVGTRLTNTTLKLSAMATDFEAVVVSLVAA